MERSDWRRAVCQILWMVGVRKTEARIKQFYSEDLSPKPDAVEKPTAPSDGVFIHPPLVISSSVGSVWKFKIQNIPV